MPKAPKLLKTPTTTATPAPSASVTPPPVSPIEQPKYTAGHLIVAKAEAFDCEMRYQVASAERQKTFVQVQEIAKYLQEYESRNSVPTGKPI